MSKERGTSSVPMIMGIIGGVLGIPGAICGGACVAGISGLAGESTKNATEMGEFYLYFALVGAAIGLIFGILGKKYPKLAGIMMILAAMMCGITVVGGNFIAIIVAILFLVGGAIALSQKKEVIE